MRLICFDRPNLRICRRNCYASSNEIGIKREEFGCIAVARTAPQYLGDSIKMDGHVFICYSRTDERFVIDLATKLKNVGVPVWLDQWDIPDGANWDKTIEDAIISCPKLIVVLSPAAVESDEVQSEWHKALKEKKKVIPILYKTCEIPRRLDLLQRIDFTSGRTDDNIAFNRVLKALGMEEGSLPKSEKITASRIEKLVPVTGAANENKVEVSSLVSDMETLTEKKEITAFGKPDVYIQDRKYFTIQEAVDIGNPGDTIILAAGTYQENLRIDKPFTIKGAGKDKTIIDGNGIGSVIIVGKNRSNIDVTLSGMTIKGGTGTSISVNDSDPKTYICGGGIINYGRLTITDSIISGNTAYYGGGIFNTGTVILEKGASLIHNAAYNGGGIYGNRKLINLNGGTVASNEAKQGGGGIYIGYHGSISIHSGTISNNVAKNSGGGIYTQGGPVTLHNGTIFANDAYSSGGGIFCYGGSANHLNGGTIHKNTARNGAGVVNGGGEMTLGGTRIHSNNADRNGNGLGGGIMNSGTLILNNGSIDHNHALKDGGGIFNTDNGKWTGNSALVHDNTLGSDRIPDDIAPLEPGG